MEKQPSRYALMQQKSAEENLYRLKLNIRSGVRQLSSEFLAMEHDPQNAERVRDLIDYMRQVISELEQFTYHDRADS